MTKQFSSNIVYGTMTVDTTVDGQNIAFGQTLSGTVYIEGEDSEDLVDYIEIGLVKKTRADEVFITKQSVEMMSDIKSKETWMISFDMVPDERRETDSEEEILILRTTVHLKNGVILQEEDSIAYA